MSLTTGDILLVYPTGWPHNGNAGLDDDNVIGGTARAGSSWNQTNYTVNLTSTGVFPTGVSTVAGGSDHIRYAKLFFYHSGDASSSLVNPLIYLFNESISDQITMAPDPFYLGNHALETGTSVNRQTLPNELEASHFTGYTSSSPMDLKAILGADITINSGDSIGFWIKRTIPAGLPSAEEVTFNIGLRGEV